jgi:oligopeptide transport system ATP-binding protein
MPDLLTVSGLETRFVTPAATVYAVNGVSFSMQEGEVLGIVGESGCGKSVAMMSILRLIPTPPGEIVQGQALYDGVDLLKMSESEIRSVRGSQIAMIFQDPMTSLNPVLTVGKQVAEPLVTHKGMNWKEAMLKAADLLRLVGIYDANAHLGDYPHQFSGGMRQRVMIAMALACSPKILIADEPTTALDVTIQAQIVDLVRRLRDEFGSAIIWITHDLGVVAGLAQRIAVMYGGRIIEQGSVDTLFENPQHPYTIGLLGSLPRLDETGRRRLVSIEGAPPVLTSKPTACPFAQRCELAGEICWADNPKLTSVGVDHTAACWVDPYSKKERS